MKYFTNELWEKINSDSSEIREEAKAKWRVNNKEYSQLFEKIKYRLPKKYLKTYLNEHGFHDYKLIRFEVIHGKSGYKEPVEIRVIITDSINTWNIIYKCIKKLRVEYMSSPMIMPGKKKEYYDGFDDIGYNEFFEVDERTLSHEILFASGATILIHFEKIMLKRVQQL